MTARIVLQSSIGIVLAAFGIRTFVLLGVVVPIEVSASSMAPTLLGPQRKAVCDGCGTRFPVDIDDGRTPGRATCHSCGKWVIDICRFPAFAGDSIWIDRTAYVFCQPRRWDLAVFRCPTDATQYCVKRIVGLPGERINLVGGNVLVNDQVVRPPRIGKGGSPLSYERSPGGAGAMRTRGAWKLGPAEYFVLGDNSRVSNDSRTWPDGPGLPHKLLVGKPLRVAW